MEPEKEALLLARNIVKAGRVNSIDRDKGTVKVLFEDRDNTISDNLPLFEFVAFPNVGDRVVCIFIGNSIDVGFCLGRYYSNENPPPSEGVS